MQPDLDQWLPEDGLRVAYSRYSTASPDVLWRAARDLPLSKTGRLGRLVRWRIPGLSRDLTMDELFRQPPFMVLAEGQRAVVSGLVGRIWTLRRDYPRLAGPADFLTWDRPGTARVAFAHWVQATEPGSRVFTEVRVQPLGNRGRIGLAAVRPIVRRFGSLVGSEGLAAAVDAAERQSRM